MSSLYSTSKGGSRGHYNIDLVSIFRTLRIWIRALGYRHPSNIPAILRILHPILILAILVSNAILSISYYNDFGPEKDKVYGEFTRTTMLAILFYSKAFTSYMAGWYALGANWSVISNVYRRVRASLEDVSRNRKHIQTTVSFLVLISVILSLMWVMGTIYFAVIGEVKNMDQPTVQLWIWTRIADVFVLVVLVGTPACFWITIFLFTLRFNELSEIIDRAKNHPQQAANIEDDLDGGSRTMTPLEKSLARHRNEMQNLVPTAREQLQLYVMMDSSTSLVLLVLTVESVLNAYFTNPDTFTLGLLLLTLAVISASSVIFVSISAYRLRKARKDAFSNFASVLEIDFAQFMPSDTGPMSA
eukprot:TRINITY_DN635_c1_g1_i11.p1 TRINITY_DN635_c1_g1~~TRINITY_DN635_c1_g1_i11.p1  ORF type:complete len:359 (+),score=27.45 TRINITY_DN635_c1_g1_i11:380-1456(+)